MCSSRAEYYKRLTLKFPQTPHGAESQSLDGKDQEITPTLKVLRASAKEKSFWLQRASSDNLSELNSTWGWCFSHQFTSSSEITPPETKTQRILKFYGPHSPSWSLASRSCVAKAQKCFLPTEVMFIEVRSSLFLQRNNVARPDKKRCKRCRGNCLILPSCFQNRARQKVAIWGTASRKHAGLSCTSAFMLHSFALSPH